MVRVNENFGNEEKIKCLEDHIKIADEDLRNSTMKTFIYGLSSAPILAGAYCLFDYFRDNHSYLSGLLGATVYMGSLILGGFFPHYSRKLSERLDGLKKIRETKNVFESKIKELKFDKN
jgi:hypothetical protein